MKNGCLIFVLLVRFIAAQTTSHPTSQPTEHFECTDLNPCSSVLCLSDCTVTCSSSFSCESIDINGPWPATNAPKMEVICGGIEEPTAEFQCRSTQISGAMNGDLHVICGQNVGSCDSITIYCPLIGLCHVEVTGYLSTNPITVDASEMWMGRLVVDSAQNSTIHCPGKETSSECSIHCGDSGCINTVIYSQSGTRLHITASGYQSLMNTKIYCPTGNGICSIQIVEGSSETLTGTVIYAPNKPIVFNVSSSSDCIHCLYQVSNPPRLYCQNYDVSCYLAVESGLDAWECNDGTIAAVMCLYPTSQPTESTLNPTVFPTAYSTVYQAITNYSVSEDEHSIEYNEMEAGIDLKVLFISISAALVLTIACVVSIWCFVGKQMKILDSMELEQADAQSAPNAVEVELEDNVNSINVVPHVKQEPQQKGECSVELSGECEPENLFNENEIAGTDSEHESMYENENNVDSGTTATTEGEKFVDHMSTV